MSKKRESSEWKWDFGVFSGQIFYPSWKVRHQFYFFHFFLGSAGFIAACRLSLVRQAEATLHCHAQTSHCGDLPCWDVWALEHTGSVVVAHGLSCSAAHGVFPDQGSNPYSPNWKADSSVTLSVWAASGLSGVWAQLLRCVGLECGVWVPWPGMELTSPALEGWFLTTGPPGKSSF